MTVEELAKAEGLEVISGGPALFKNVTGGYCGDLLSWVMGRASAGCAWITVMGNVNAIAVAVLADTACIILAEGAQLDKDAQLKAKGNSVAVLRSEKGAYELALCLFAALSSRR